VQAFRHQVAPVPRVEGQPRLTGGIRPDIVEWSAFRALPARGKG